MVFNEREKLIYLHGCRDLQKIMLGYCQLWMELNKSRDISITELAKYVEQRYKEIEQKEEINT